MSNTFKTGISLKFCLSTFIRLYVVADMYINNFKRPCKLISNTRNSSSKDDGGKAS